MIQNLTIEQIQKICQLSATLHQTLDRAVGAELETFINRLSNEAKHELGALFLVGKGEAGSFEQQLKRVNGAVGALHLTLRRQSRLAAFLSAACASLGIDLAAPAEETEEPIDDDAEEQVDAAAA
jgi:hypothetical protein